jgi:fructose-1,6-bisphosphatase/inositol monophosphatase family enzyme
MLMFMRVAADSKKKEHNRVNNRTLSVTFHLTSLQMISGKKKKEASNWKLVDLRMVGSDIMTITYVFPVR